MAIEILSVRNYKAGYVVREEKHTGEDAFGGPEFTMKIARNLNGDYIGLSRDAYRLCNKRGIKPELANPDHSVCSIGFCADENKWFGWSHRAIYGFTIGDVVKEGDCTASSGWIDEYLAEHPEDDLSLPIGFEAKTIDDAKRMAIAFAESVG